MNWEATLMSDEQIEAIQVTNQGGNVDDLNIAKAQAEVSFKAGEEQGIKTTLIAYESTCETLIQQAKKAGIKEVVEWIQEYSHLHYGSNQEELLFMPKNNWQFKLREWGIK